MSLKTICHFVLVEYSHHFILERAQQNAWVGCQLVGGYLSLCVECHFASHPSTLNVKMNQ